MATALLAALLTVLAVAPPCAAFAPAPGAVATGARARPPASSRPRRAASSAKRDDADAEPTTNPLELASWYAVEAFGKAFGGKGAAADDPAAALDLSRPPASLAETRERVRRDIDRSYFLSGVVDRYVYDEACTFADPFVAFDGRERFIDNLANLGSFITEYDAKMIAYDVDDAGGVIDAKVMVKLELNLPWKPVLAWPWGVKYLVDPDTCLVTDHIESWDIAPLEGVKQIFRRPTVKIFKK